MRALSSTPTVTLHAVREAIAASGRWPVDDVTARRAGLHDAAHRELVALTGTAAQAVAILDLLLHERREAMREADALELVWSGPEEGATETRETAVVLRELFLSAKRSVLVATYVLANGDAVFADLAGQLDRHPELDVRLLVQGRIPDNRDPDPLPALRQHLMANWPGTRRPRFFLDPRTVPLSNGKRVTMHAKFVVVDDEIAFITSANFTEAAQDRNVEAGVVVRRRDFATRLTRHVDRLIAQQLLVAFDG